MEKRNNDYPTIRELTYRNAEKIDLMLEEIKEIKQKMDCLISIKQDLAKHKAYFKVMGGGIGIIASLIILILEKLF